MTTSTRICLVIPCYNEATRLPIAQITEALDEDRDLELCFVNDGSSDDTRAILDELRSENDRVEVLDLAENVGKAEAVRAGMLKVSTKRNIEYVGYFDADMATPLTEARSMIDRLPKGSAHVMIVGSRVKLLGSTNIVRLWYRHYFGRIFATVVSNMLGLAVYDTQCGAKLFKRQFVNDLFHETFQSKWLFDVELFYRCLAHFGYADIEKRLIELNVSEWKDVGGSKLSAVFVLRVPFELLAIRNRYAKRIGHKARR